MTMGRPTFRKKYRQLLRQWISHFISYPSLDLSFGFLEEEIFLRYILIESSCVLVLGPTLYPKNLQIVPRKVNGELQMNWTVI